MPRKPYMKLFPTDWLAGTRDLTLEEQGLYLELCLLCDIDGSVPKDPKLIAKKLGRDPRQVRKILETSPRDVGDISETSPRHLRDISETSPRVRRHFVSVSPTHMVNKRISADHRRYKKGSPNQKQNLEAESSSSFSNSEETRLCDKPGPVQEYRGLRKQAVPPPVEFRKAAEKFRRKKA